MVVLQYCAMPVEQITLVSVTGNTLEPLKIVFAYPKHRWFKSLGVRLI